MNPVETLKAVLCGQDGKCCIAGSEADRKVVDEALAALAALDAAQPEPLITYRHKDGNTRFEHYAKDPVPDWAVDVQPVQPERAPLSDAEIDRVLGTHIPGGSHARDWFLPHELPKGKENVRDVVRRMIATAHGIKQGGPHD